MKKLLIHCSLFILPLVFIVFLLPINERSKFIGLKDDCFNHGIWMYDRIHENETPVDIAFVGSSHTINGINDTLISHHIKGVEAVNFGYCRLGRNLHFSLVKDIISEKKIRILVLEIRERENRYSHPVFPLIADSKDVVLANPFFNKDYFSDIWENMVYKLELLQEQIFNNSKTVSISKKKYGFITSSDTISQIDLKNIIASQGKRKKELGKFSKKFHNTYSKIYLSKIKKLCIDDNVQLVFMYLPSLGNKENVPEEIEYYKSLGTVLIPPKEILIDSNNWFDINHFNESGAYKTSLWLANELSGM